MAGWIKIHRKIREWRHFGEPNVLAVFLDLLLTANTEPGWHGGMRVGRGQTCVTVSALCADLNLSRPTVIKILKSLVSSGEIKRKMVKNGCITTIVKFNDYQDNSQSVGKDGLPTTLPTTLPIQEYKEYNNITLSARAREEILEELFSQGSAVEQFCMSNGTDAGTCEEIARAIMSQWALAGVTHTGKADARRHLVSLIRIELEKRRRAAASAPRKTKEQVRQERIREIYERNLKYETHDKR